MNKYSIFPIRHPRLWEAFKKQQHAFWTAEELDLGGDLSDWRDKLNDGERHYIKHVLAFFAQSDGIVNENLALRFYKDIEIPEARAFYTAQMMIETVHAETYGLLIETYIQDQKERDKLFNAIETLPTITKKADWALKWVDSADHLENRLFAFAIVEGLFFSGAFCSIFWLRKRGLMPGLSSANDLISRDEGLHWEFAALVMQDMGLSVAPTTAEAIIVDAVAIEKEFIRDALPVRLIGMNADLMCEYIEYTADRILNRFGFNKMYNTKNPFDFMNLIDMETKKNFFEKRVVEYARAKDTSISFDVPF